MSTDKSPIEIIEQTIQDNHCPSQDNDAKQEKVVNDTSQEKEQKKKSTSNDANSKAIIISGLFHYALLLMLMIFSFAIYNIYFDKDTNEQTKIVILDINENMKHVIAQGGDENDIVKYNRFVTRLLSDRGFIVLDRSSILGPVPNEYLAPLFDLSAIESVYSTYKPTRPISKLTQQ